jgi:hypothetical protein
VPHHLDASGIRQEQPGEELEQRRLAGAVRAEQRDELPAFAVRLTPASAFTGP